MHPFCSNGPWPTPVYGCSRDGPSAQTQQVVQVTKVAQEATGKAGKASFIQLMVLRRHVEPLEEMVKYGKNFTSMEKAISARYGNNGNT